MSFQFQLSQNHIELQKNIANIIVNASSEDKALAEVAKAGYMSTPNLEGTKQTDYLGLILTVEEIAKTYPRVANQMVELLFAQEIVKAHAKDENKCECASKIQNLEKRVNVLYSEPGNYGLNSLGTKIEKQGEKYTVTGTKIFTPENEAADVYFVIGKLQNSNIAFAAIHAKDINVEVKNIVLGNKTVSTKLATIKAEIEADCIFTNVNVNSLQKPLTVWRTLIAASAIGLAHTNLVSSLNTVKGIKNSDNQQLSAAQGIQFPLADSFGEIEAARMLTYYTSALLDAGTASLKFSSMSKVQATEAALLASNNASMLLGNLGNICDEEYLLTLQLAYNRLIKDGTPRNNNNIIYEEALAKR